jgi:hypothetical protein
MLRNAHFPDNQPIDGGEVVSHIHWLSFILQEDYWYSLLLQAESTPGPSMAGRIR